MYEEEEDWFGREGSSNVDRILNTGYWILNTGYWILDTGY
jgi:hypothetical protein